ncbi:MAG: hypothetical protein Q7W30_06395 [Coriobacteriia bacterium]|nr:hypothetical protein [Coriobacteriia bacterium]
MKLTKRVALVIALALTFALFATPLVASACQGLDVNAPAAPVKLVFAHHSTGGNWLADGNGYLGASLRNAGYYVSDTNYGWGPDAIGDRTDVGDWWTWFRGSNAGTYTAALYAQSGQSAGYSRLATDPGGENEIVMFKSCYPNSSVGGSAADVVPAIGSNPLAGNGMSGLTVGNAKGVYTDLLEYFKTKPDKLFVLVVSPPLVSGATNAAEAANARVLANWLVDPNGWLKGYPLKNVVAFDFFAVLTGGSHTIVNGSRVHTIATSNYLKPAYATSAYDSHPNPAGGQYATAQFVPFLNAAYHAWKGDGRPMASMRAPAPSVSRPVHRRAFYIAGTCGAAHTVSTRVTLTIERRVRGRWVYARRVYVTLAAGRTAYRVRTSLTYAGAYRVRAYHVCASHVYGASGLRYFTVR